MIGTKNRMRFQTRESVVILALWALLVASRPARAQSWELSALRALAGLTPDQWAVVNRGEPQARALDTQVKREVAVIGVARLKATTACFVTKFKEIENIQKNPAVLRIREFVQPAGPRGTLLPIGLLALDQVVKPGEILRRRICTLAAALTLIGIFAMRWNVVVGGQLFSKSFLGYTNYKMAFAAREGLLPAIALLILPFLILWRLLKLLPPWAEQKV